MTVRITNNGFFNLITSKDNKMYQCSVDELLDFNSDFQIKNIFKAIAFYKGGITGAEILLSYTVDDTTFHNPISAICVALGLINSQAVPQIMQLKPFISEMQQNTVSLYAQLYARQNTLSFNSRAEESILLPFDLSGSKIVVCKTKIENSYHESKQADDTELMNKIYENISKTKASNTELNNLLEEKYFDHKTQPSKKTSKLFKLYRLTKDSGLCTLNLIDFENGMFACIVNNRNTDDFTNALSDIYNSTEGSIPELYICDSADSGVEIFE